MSDKPTREKLEEGCVKCLDYFGIFKYPLTDEEIHRFHPYQCELEDVREILHEMHVGMKVYRHHNFYMLDDQESWALERLKGNERAYQLLNRSGRYISIVASFPFVRGIAVSGSLSKFYASENPDLDYFIITSANRLWIARTFLHLFKKLTFLSGHEHYFCMNYFIDTEALKNSSRNLYGAIETLTLLPAYNEKLIQEYVNTNRWAEDYLPNHPGMNRRDYLLPDRKRPFKKLAEVLLNLLAPQRMNRFWMKLTDRKWRKKWSGFNYSEDDYNRAFQTEIHISKNHPADYEKKVLSSLEKEKKQEAL